MPTAMAASNPAKMMTPAGLGSSSPRTSHPARYNATFEMASSAASATASLSGSGRSPGPSGASPARMRSSRSRPRAYPRRMASASEGGRAAVAPGGRRLRLRCPNGDLQQRAERPGGALRDGGLGDRADDDDAAGGGGRPPPA